MATTVRITRPWWLFGWTLGVRRGTWFAFCAAADPEEVRLWAERQLAGIEDVQ